jgi:nucleotide-binding universal stress UspA family protein
MTSVSNPVDSRVFTRIVCAVDRSEYSLEAVRQASLLTPAPGHIELVGVVETLGDAYSPYGGAAAVSEAAHSMAARLAEAHALCPHARTELLEGPRVARLLRLVEEGNATLIAVGAGKRHRSVGVVLGDIATEMLHRARSSVLIARGTSQGDTFPRSVVVGYDGSTGARAALRAAREIAERTDASVRVLTGGDVTLTNFDDLADVAFDHDRRSPVAALVAASAEADLVIVGSRGLRGLSALGSVSERVAHQSSCSVLVVRPMPKTDSAA